MFLCVWVFLCGVHVVFLFVCFLVVIWSHTQNNFHWRVKYFWLACEMDRLCIPSSCINYYNTSITLWKQYLFENFAMFHPQTHHQHSSVCALLPEENTHKLFQLTFCPEAIGFVIIQFWKLLKPPHIWDIYRPTYSDKLITSDKTEIAFPQSPTSVASRHNTNILAVIS